MNKVTATFAPALIAGLAFASPALAQVGIGADASAGAGVSAGGSGAGVDVGTTASGQATDAAGNKLDLATTAATSGAAEAPDIGHAVSAMAQTTATVSSNTDIQAIRVISLEKAGDGAADTAAKIDDGQVQALQNAIKGNAAINATLQANGIDLASIRAADFDANGNLVVYVD